MDQEPNLKVVNVMQSMCSHCQLYAAKYFIWNCEVKTLEEVIIEAFNTLPGLVSPDGLSEVIGNILDQFSPEELDIIQTHAKRIAELKRREPLVDQGA